MNSTISYVHVVLIIHDIVVVATVPATESAVIYLL